MARNKEPNERPLGELLGGILVAVLIVAGVQYFVDKTGLTIVVGLVLLAVLALAWKDYRDNRDYRRNRAR